MGDDKYLVTHEESGAEKQFTCLQVHLVYNVVALTTVCANLEIMTMLMIMSFVSYGWVFDRVILTSYNQTRCLCF